MTPSLAGPALHQKHAYPDLRLQDLSLSMCLILIALGQAEMQVSTVVAVQTMPCLLLN